MEEARRRTEELERKRSVHLQGCTDKIFFFGLWQNDQSVDDMLNGIQAKTEKRKPLMYICSPRMERGSVLIELTIKVQNK